MLKFFSIIIIGVLCIFVYVWLRDIKRTKKTVTLFRWGIVGDYQNKTRVPMKLLNYIYIYIYGIEGCLVCIVLTVDLRNEVSMKPNTHVNHLYYLFVVKKTCLVHWKMYLLAGTGFAQSRWPRLLFIAHLQPATQQT